MSLSSDIMTGISHIKLTKPMTETLLPLPYPSQPNTILVDALPEPLEDQRPQHHSQHSTPVDVIGGTFLATVYRSLGAIHIQDNPSVGSPVPGSHYPPRV